MSILDGIKSPQDVKQLNEKQLCQLAGEIRQFLISTVSRTGGHIASNLGVVELSLALHRVMDSPNDKIVFDVGHQCYTHKIITGRLAGMSTLRSIDGLSGFPKPYESVHDAFATGHSSTSISVALGYACAAKIKGETHTAVAVIGDGALTGGQAFEALSNAGRSEAPVIVVLNDNGMAIERNVGAIARGLTKMRTSRRYFRTKDRIYNFINRIPGVGKGLSRFISRCIRKVKNLLYGTTIFEDLGLTYLGPVNGHDIERLTILLERAKRERKPCLIHISTVKGKGFDAAEHDPVTFHGAPSFDPRTGEFDHAVGEDFSAHFGATLTRLAEKDERICAVTAAMAVGCGLHGFSLAFPERLFDVGIAEQHAVTFSSALAAGGMLPVFAVYSTFLQRGYDQLIHDLALSGKKVVLAVDRAGIVGADGETHQGLFDSAFLSSVPGLTILAPASFAELDAALDAALYKISGAVAIRYPRAGEPTKARGMNTMSAPYAVLSGGQSGRIALVGYGTHVFELCKAAESLGDIAPCIVKLNCLTDFGDSILGLLSEFDDVIIAEEGSRAGGAGQHLASLLAERAVRTHVLAVDGFVQQGSREELLRRLGLDSAGIVKYVREVCAGGKNTT